jgi:hypothetical protein
VNLGDISETTRNKKREYLEKKNKELKTQRGMKW